MSDTNRSDKPWLMLVGAGSVGQELMRRSAPFWRLILVDHRPEVLEQIRQLLETTGEPTPVCRLYQGDGTSSLVLEEAGIEEADAVVVTTSDDRVNLEVCRIAAERFKKRKVVALIHNDAPAGFPIGASVEFVKRNEKLAILLENKLHHGSSRSVLYGTGEGHIIETEVMAGSPVIGRPLEEFNTPSWRVAAIHREKELILPRHDTSLKQGDHVLLIGKPDVLPNIAEYIRIGVSEFPRRFGDKLVVPVFPKAGADAFLEEILFLSENTKIDTVEILCWNPQAEELRNRYAARFSETGRSLLMTPCVEDPVDTLLEVAAKGNVGCLVLPHPVRFAGQKTLGRRPFLRILEEVTCPILISRGTQPYRRILVPVTDKAESMAAAELAMDLARLLGSRITAASVLPPAFSVGEESRESQREALSKTLSLGNLYRMSIEKVETEGNPVREVLKTSRDYDLMVVSHRRDRRWAAFRSDVSHHLILRAPCSVLVVEMGKKKS